MSEEETSITTTSEEAISEEEPEEGEELLPIEEEFKSLYSDAHKIKDRWLRLAKTKEEEKDSGSAQLIRLIANDLMTLIIDTIAASGGGFEDLNVAVADQAEAEEGHTLSDDEVVQLYVTLMSNEKAFSQMAEQAEAEAKDALMQLVKLNQGTMGLLRDNFGEEIVKVSEEQIAQVAQT